MNNDVESSVFGMDRNETVKSLPLAFRLTMAVVTVIFTLLIIIGNIMCIVLFAKSKEFKNSTGYFYISLAAVDLGMGAIVPLYTYSMYYGSWPYGDIVCDIAGWLRSGLVFCSVWHMFFLTFDTFLAIYTPLKHRHILCYRTCMIIIVISWSSALIICMLPFVGVGRYEYLEYNGYCLFDSLKSPEFTYVIIAYCAPALVLVYVLNCWIWCIARRRVLGLQRKRHGQSCYPVNRNISLQQRTTLKASQTILVILIFFTLSTMVMYIMHAVQSIFRVRIPIYVAIIGGYMGLANHWINIFVYTYMNKKIRWTFIRLFCCCFNCRTNRSSGSVSNDGSTTGAVEPDLPRSSYRTQIWNSRMDLLHEEDSCTKL